MQHSPYCAVAFLFLWYLVVCVLRRTGGGVLTRLFHRTSAPQSLARRPSSSTFEAFLNIEGAASSFPVRSPTVRSPPANDKAALPDDVEETFSGFGSAPLSLGVGESSGVNPLFGMVDGDETFNGFEAADATEEAGFGFGFGGELGTNDFGGSTTGKLHPSCAAPCARVMVYGPFRTRAGARALNQNFYFHPLARP